MTMIDDRAIQKVIQLRDQMINDTIINEINIEQWFKASNYEHRKAYAHLNNTGQWPDGFIPSNVVMSVGWRYWIMSTLIDYYLDREGLL